MHAARTSSTMPSPNTLSSPTPLRTPPKENPRNPRTSGPREGTGICEGKPTSLRRVQCTEGGDVISPSPSSK